MNYYSDEKEWVWLFKNAIDWDQIIPLYFPEFPTEEGINNKEEAISFMSEILDNLGNWSGNSITEMAPIFDAQGAGEVRDGKTYPNETLEKMYKEATDLGVFGLNVPKECGGMGLPTTLQIINLAMISRGYIGACGQLSFFNAAADMIHRFCPKHIQDKYIPLIIEGKSSGSMCMTEPGSGSDLGAIKTTATPTSEKGHFLLNGTKMFISNAGGGIAFILARIQGAPEGLGGLSFFFAEHLNEDGTPNYYVVKNEHKMGMHGAFTCEVLYENTKAILIGEEGQGFKFMLELMNEARICTGVQAVAGIEASLSYALKYANERQQFGKPIAELPLMKRNLQDMETERDALRALAVDTISHYDVFQFLSTKKKHQGELNQAEEKQLSNALIWTRKRTPIIKYYATEAYTSLSTKSLQVLGGYGFMQEYYSERFHRDSFGPLLYEGTSQIQALMAMKDLVKQTMKNPQAFFSKVVSNSAGGQLLAKGTSSQKEFQKINTRYKRKVLGLLIKCLKPKSTADIFNIKKWQEEENFNRLMIHAETICQGLSYLETLRVLSSHTAISSDREDLFNRYSKLVAPRFEAIFNDWKNRE